MYLFLRHLTFRMRGERSNRLRHRGGIYNLSLSLVEEVCNIRWEEGEKGVK